MKVTIELQEKGEKSIECENFDLKRAVDIINGNVKDDQGNRVVGFMVGDKHYFRALEVVSIEVQE